MYSYDSTTARHVAKIYSYIHTKLKLAIVMADVIMMYACTSLCSLKSVHYIYVHEC